jgi:hypothetical protein
MLVTDKGQLIRTQVDGIRIAGRSTQGVIVFDTARRARGVGRGASARKVTTTAGEARVEPQSPFIPA